MKTQTMSLYDAVNAIGNYIVTLAPDVWAKDRNNQPLAAFPAPVIFFPTGGAPSLTVRWDDGFNESSGMDLLHIPATLFFEVRCIHPSYPDAGASDYLVQAQNETLRGASALMQEFENDPTLDKLVMDVQIPRIFSGPLVDYSGNQFYGTQINLSCKIH